MLHSSSSLQHYTTVNCKAGINKNIRGAPIEVTHAQQYAARCHALQEKREVTGRMGRRKQKKSTQKSPPTRGVTTRNALRTQPSASIANATVSGCNPNAEEATAAKRSHGKRIMKKDVPKLLKKVMEDLEDTDSESDGEPETPITEEVLMIAEEQTDSTVGM